MTEGNSWGCRKLHTLDCSFWVTFHFWRKRFVLKLSILGPLGQVRCQRWDWVPWVDCAPILLTLEILLYLLFSVLGGGYLTLRRKYNQSLKLGHTKCIKNCVAHFVHRVMRIVNAPSAVARSSKPNRNCRKCPASQVCYSAKLLFLWRWDSGRFKPLEQRMSMWILRASACDFPFSNAFSVSFFLRLHTLDRTDFQKSWAPLSTCTVWSFWGFRWFLTVSHHCGDFKVTEVLKNVPNFLRSFFAARCGRCSAKIPQELPETFSFPNCSICFGLWSVIQCTQ